MKIAATAIVLVPVVYFVAAFNMPRVKAPVCVDDVSRCEPQ